MWDSPTIFFMIIDTLYMIVAVIFLIILMSAVGYIGHIVVEEKEWFMFCLCVSVYICLHVILVIVVITYLNI